MNATVIRLSDDTRKLLKLMHFETVPDEANYLAFFEDGNAAFFEEFNAGAHLSGILMPRIALVPYYENVNLELQ